MFPYLYKAFNLTQLRKIELGRIQLQNARVVHNDRYDVMQL